MQGNHRFFEAVFRNGMQLDRHLFLLELVQLTIQETLTTLKIISYCVIEKQPPDKYNSIPPDISSLNNILKIKRQLPFFATSTLTTFDLGDMVLKIHFFTKMNIVEYIPRKINSQRFMSDFIKKFCEIFFLLSRSENFLFKIHRNESGTERGMWVSAQILFVMVSLQSAFLFSPRESITGLLVWATSRSIFLILFPTGCRTVGDLITTQGSWTPLHLL